jgi:hypothetical protein
MVRWDILVKTGGSILSALFTASSIVLNGLHRDQANIWQVDWWWQLAGFIVFAVLMGWAIYDLHRQNKELSTNIPYLQKKQVEHLDKIVTLMTDWNNSFIVPKVHEVEIGTRLNNDSRLDFLFKYLQYHFPFPELWGKYTSSETKLREYIKSCKKLRNDILATWDCADTIVLPAFAIPILKIIEGESQLDCRLYYREDMPIADPKYQWLVINGLDIVKGKDIGVVSKEVTGPLLDEQILVKKYLAIADKFKCDPHMFKFQTQFSDLVRLEIDINNMLQGIIESADYTLHYCKLCPMNPSRSGYVKAKNRKA